MTWSEWKRMNADTLKNFPIYWESFVDSIIAKLDGVKPENVIVKSQEYFLCNECNNIFIIQKDNIYLPISLWNYVNLYGDTYDIVDDILKYSFLVRHYFDLSKSKILYVYFKDDLVDDKVIISELNQAIVLQQKGSRKAISVHFNTHWNKVVDYYNHLDNYMTSHGFNKIVEKATRQYHETSLIKIIIRELYEFVYFISFIIVLIVVIYFYFEFN